MLSSREIEEIKQQIIEKINQIYDPAPKKCEVWFEEQEGMFRSIVQVDENSEIYLTIWDKDNLDLCLEEISLTSKTFEKIYKFTDRSQLFEKTVEGVIN